MPMTSGHRQLLAVATSAVTLVMAIAVTSATPIYATGELNRPVLVGNTDANPVPARLPDDPARHPVRISPPTGANQYAVDGISHVITPRLFDGTNDALIASIPAGETLVVDYLDALVSMPPASGSTTQPNQFFVDMCLPLGGSCANFPITMTPQTSPPGGFNFTGETHPNLTYRGGGQGITFAFWAPGGSTGQANVSIYGTGHLVTTP